MYRPHCLCCDKNVSDCLMTTGWVIYRNLCTDCSNIIPEHIPKEQYVKYYSKTIDKLVAKQCEK